MRLPQSLAAILATLTLLGAAGDANTVFVGFITDTECGANHAPMIAKGGMGKDDRECTLKCVQKGATFGFVEQERKKFYQLDEQDIPAPLVGQKVRIEGHIEGDTIYLKSISAAE
jgi:hypothetical protein